MAYPSSNVHLEWIRMAEESAKQGDYETAASHMIRVAHYFRLNKDMSGFREFVRKTGDCYLHAAENLWNSGRLEKASILYIKAAECYRMIGEKASTDNCSLPVHKFYDMVIRNNFASFPGSASDLKRFGDFLREEGNLGGAEECYEAAARKALEEGRLILAGRLFGDAGDCSSSLNNAERTASNYALAADSYFKSGRYFEAAWHYNISGFLLISLGRFAEASSMASKAKRACSVGDIPIFLAPLSRICELLSARDYFAANEEWQKIRRKFKKNYADLIDSCFQGVKEVQS